MKHFAAYALLVLSGKERPVESDVEKVLAAAGIKAEEGKVAALCAAMKDKDFHAVVAEGLTKMSSMGSAAPAQAAASAAPAKAAAKVEEVVEDEVDMDMGDLFGGDY